MNAPLEELRFRGRQTHERVLKLVDELTDEQLRWRPSAKAHSIGWTLWHIARADDNVLFDLSGASLWRSGAYAARWKHPERGSGTGWEDEEAASLPLPAKDELLTFAREVFAAVDLARVGLDEARFADEIAESRFLSERTTKGGVVGAELTHDNRHLGELEYIKGLLGLRGTVTR